MNITLKRHFWLLLILIGIILAGIGFSWTRILTYNFWEYETDITTYTASELSLYSTSKHDISIDISSEKYKELIDTYTTTGEKEYIKADITIDGTLLEDVGIRLRWVVDVLTIEWGTWVSLPSLVVQFDKYMPWQLYGWVSEIVLRSGDDTSTLMELLTYELRVSLWLTTPEHGWVATVTLGSIVEWTALISESINDWYLVRTWLADTHVIYKALSSLSLQYLGEDPTSYVWYFEQETSINHDDMKLLINLLRFIEESDDTEFIERISEHIDIDNYLSYIALADILSDDESVLIGLIESYYIAIDRDTWRAVFIPWDQGITLDTSTTPLTELLREYIKKSWDNINIRDIDELIQTTSSWWTLWEKNTYQNTLKTRILAIEKYRTLYEENQEKYQSILRDSTALTDILTDAWVSLTASEQEKIQTLSSTF